MTVCNLKEVCRSDESTDDYDLTQFPSALQSFIVFQRNVGNISVLVHSHRSRGVFCTKALINPLYVTCPAFPQELETKNGAKRD